jgi:hypothetical protein
MHHHAVVGDERDVHVRALADVAVGVDEDAVVEALFLGLHLHQDVGQVVGGLGDGVERRLDRIGGGHHPHALGLPLVGVDQAREDHHEEPGIGAGRRHQVEAARPRRQPVANRAVAPSARGGGLDDDVAHLGTAARQLQLGALRRLDEAIEVRLEIVDPAVDDAGGVEDAVAAVDHVIVERNHHQRRIRHHAAKLAGVERRVLDRLPGAQRLQLIDHVGGRQDAQAGG